MYAVKPRKQKTETILKSTYIDSKFLYTSDGTDTRHVTARREEAVETKNLQDRRIYHATAQNTERGWIAIHMAGPLRHNGDLRRHHLNASKYSSGPEEDLLGKEEQQEQPNTHRPENRREDMVVDGEEDTGRVDETLGCRDVAGHSGLREHADRGDCVCHGRHLLRGPRRLPCTVGDTCLFPVLGMVPVRDGPRTQSVKVWSSRGTARCRENRTPKGNNPRREGGRQRHHRRVHQDSRPVSPFCVFTFAWGCHSEESCKLSAGSQPSQPATDD